MGDLIIMTNRLFPLAGLLRVRKLSESAAAGELSSANGRLNQGSHRLDNLMRRASEADEPIHDASTLLAVAAGRSATNSALTEHLAHMDELRSAVDVAEKHYADSKRDVKIVQKLKERHDVSVEKADLASEQKIIDEAASRSNRGGF